MSALPPDPFSTPSQPPPGFQPVVPDAAPSTAWPSPEVTTDAGGPVLVPVRWGMGDAALGLFLANLLAAVVGGIVLGALGFYDLLEPPDLDVVVKEVVPVMSLGLTALLQVPLWTGYLGVPLWAARAKGNGVVRDFGFRMRWFDVPIGVGAGLATQLVLIPALYLPFAELIDLDALSEPARQLTERATDPVGVVLLVLVVAVGAPIVEELFFRGLVLRSVERRFGTVVAVIASSLLFGAVHLQLLQLPALTLFGLVAALLTVKTGRLGPAIWAHVVFNGTATALLLAGA